MPDLFRDGDYTALAANGTRAAHVVAFTRTRGDMRCLVVSGRLFALLAGTPGQLADAQAWADTTITR